MARQIIYVPYGQQPPKQRTRVFTWIILAINVLFLIWIIVGVAGNSGHATNCGTLSQQTCDSAKNAGTAIGVGLIILFWALADVILGVLWLVTRRSPQIVFTPPASPNIPQAQQPPMGAAAPGWYPDPEGSNRQRWWDGGRWTEHVQPHP